MCIKEGLIAVIGNVGLRLLERVGLRLVEEVGHELEEQLAELGPKLERQHGEIHEHDD